MNINKPFAQNIYEISRRACRAHALRRQSSLVKFAFLAAILAGLALAAQAHAQENRPDLAFKLFLPIARKSAPYDLSIDALRPYQVTQNAANSVPLVSGKTTVLRIFTHTTQSAPVNGLSVSILATRNGAPLPNSPLVVRPVSAPTSIIETNLSNSINVTLPEAWLSGSIRLEITIDSTNVYPESDEGNNTRSLALTFTNVPPLNIKVIPVIYTHPDDKITYTPSTTAFLSPGILRMYPVAAVNVVERTGVAFNQNLSNTSSWYNLLDIITNLKVSDGAPANEIYYGLIPIEDQLGHRWFNGGVAGLGWVGQRTAIGLTDSPTWVLHGDEIAAHEIGHNLGREHAPCGVQKYDQRYPYSDGSIGNIGVQVSPLTLYSPSSYTDLMGYCHAKWVSDYTYQGLMANQISYGAAALLTPQDGLLVRGQLDQAGDIQLKSSYRLTSLPQAIPETAEAEVQFLDSSGEIVERTAVSLLRAPEADEQGAAISAFVPWPAKPFTMLRLVNLAQGSYDEKPLRANRLAVLAQPRLDLTPAELTLSWGDPNTPALVRMRSQGADAWTTLALDAMGGQLDIDPAVLPPGVVEFEIILADQSTPGYTLNWRYNLESDD